MPEVRVNPQMLGQLPKECINLQDVFDNTGVDYAGPIYIKTRCICKPIITMGYVAVFVSIFVKAVHLEPVPKLTTSAFVATLRRFILRR